MSGFTHTYKIRRMRVRTNPDTSGRGGLSQDGTLTVRGRVAVASVRERYRAAQFGMDLAAVALAPLDTDVDEPDEVTVDGISRHVDGEYKVAAIQHTPVHLRLMLTRKRRP